MSEGARPLLGLERGLSVQVPWPGFQPPLCCCRHILFLSFFQDDFFFFFFFFERERVGEGAE